MQDGLHSFGDLGTILFDRIFLLTKIDVVLKKFSSIDLAFYYHLNKSDVVSHRRRSQLSNVLNYVN